MRALPDPTQGDLYSKAVVTPSAAMQQVEFAVCEGCGKAFKPNRADHRNCSAACRKRLERRKKRDRVLSPDVTLSSAPAAPPGRGNSVPKADRRSLTPCRRPDWLSGLLEGVDSDGLPIFFDGHGDRLLRVWQGTVALSAVELRVMRLEPTDVAFPNGDFYREVAK
jgi:predicted nucleic acid-binding Zn ribbon protein